MTPSAQTPGGPCAFRLHGAHHRTVWSLIMKRIALVAAALVLAACSAKEEAPAADTAAAAPAAAMDSAAMAAPADSTAMAAPADSTAMADTTKH
ncbi:hypothetical protein GEMMAAP_03710 [Gemmatimonas phototrophica]|uniref:Uncharacterized protein n=2 Tax=Gemmatimonas phototrophica TaxID=1379270 RepID=A0A143BHV3_9BACT|nr:hypothetical protein GEMMAAP_03710 [Gemmatimonas phototrophica]